MKRKTKYFILIFIFLTFAAFFTAFLINFKVKATGAKFIFTNIKKLKKTYTALVPGAFVYKSGRLSTILEDRIITAYKLYKHGKIKRFLLSGDHGKKTYDEVNAMKDYLIKKGVSEKDIFTDHAGFRTYDSVVRAKKVFNVKKVTIVTQKYHLYRALYIARKKGLTAYGFAANRHKYLKIKLYKFREFMARVKAFFDVLFNIKPKFLGPKIPIKGDSSLSRG